MSGPIFNFFRKLPPARAISRFSKRVSLPGFDGLSLYEVSVFFGRGINKGGLQTRASSMAYNFFLAIFPAIIFMFTLIPFVPIPHFQDELFETLRDIMPTNAFLAIEDTITEILHNHNTSLLSIGFLTAMYFSTNGLTSMMDAFNKSIHVREYRMQWKQRLIAIGLSFFLVIVLIIGISLMIGSEYMLGNMLKTDSASRFFIQLGKWIILGLLFMFIIGVYYRVAPAKKLHKNMISPGVLLATVLIIITSLLFAWYVNNFGKYNKLYGSIGSIIVVLIWIYYNSMMLLLGFELDAGIAGARQRRQSLLEHEEEEVEKEKRLLDETVVDSVEDKSGK